MKCKCGRAALYDAVLRVADAFEHSSGVQLCYICMSRAEMAGVTYVNHVIGLVQQRVELVAKAEDCTVMFRVL